MEVHHGAIIVVDAFRGDSEQRQARQLSLALRAYPRCTSDNCTTAAFADDTGLNWQHIEEVVLVVKAAAEPRRHRPFAIAVRDRGEK